MFALQSEVNYDDFFTSDVLLNQDNGRPHSVRSMVTALHDIKFLTHPPYLPDITPSDFHVFGRLSEVMGGELF